MAELDPTGPATKAQMQKFKEKMKNTTAKKDKVEFAGHLATRDKLERDYQEDHIYVTFNSSPQTRRTILARRPNKKEFIEILKLGVEAAKFEGLGDPQSLEKLSNTYSRLNELAATLSVDKNLDTKFWDEKVSFAALWNFINELVSESQQNIGGVTESELQSFRGE